MIRMVLPANRGPPLLTEARAAAMGVLGALLQQSKALPVVGLATSAAFFMLLMLMLMVGL